jgi:molybdate/tungstate transport system substrate-binding protein
MTNHTSGLRRNTVMVAVASLLGAASLASAAAPAVAATTAATEGPVDVIAAGSLEDTLAALGPAFTKATGDTLVPTTNGSTADATAIKGKTTRQDVFISAGAAGEASLMGKANGNWASWYAKFGTTPLLLGYDPKSKFAHDLLTMPWYKVVAMPGFLLGRTDPATDPKGALAVTALDDAAKAYKLPVLKTLATETSNVYTEDSLVGRLQAGQVDAGFFYGVEASAAKIKTVTMAPVHLTNPYMISILNGAAHPAEAAAFVAWLLGPGGSAILKSEGLSIVKPAVLTGPKFAVPASLRPLFS